jgi:hypothetical protein
LFARAGGCADEPTLSEIRELCLGALRAVDDPVCAGKLLIVHCCAAALYSDRAHRHWDRAETTGVDRLRQKIFRALNGLQRRLYALDTGTNPAQPQACHERAQEIAAGPQGHPPPPRGRQDPAPRFGAGADRGTA